MTDDPLNNKLDGIAHINDKNTLYLHLISNTSS